MWWTWKHCKELKFWIWVKAPRWNPLITESRRPYQNRIGACPVDGSRIPCCPVDNSSKNNKKTHSENFPLEDNSWNTATANGRYSVEGKMNFLIKIHIGLFVYGLFIKAARIFGVYSVETDIFGNYFHFFSVFVVWALVGVFSMWTFWPNRVYVGPVASVHWGWQIMLIGKSFPSWYQTTQHWDLRLHLRERERGKEIIAFASFYFFYSGFETDIARLAGQHPQAMEKIHHKYIFHEYLSKMVLHFSLARCRWKEEGCVIREKGRKTLVRSGCFRDGDFIAADTSDISASACRTFMVKGDTFSVLYGLC